MPQFNYKARKRSGEVVQGMLEVADRPTALAQLERLGLFPVAVQAAGTSEGRKMAKAASGGSAASAEGRSGWLPPVLRGLLKRQRRPKMQELGTYSQQLANLLKSGMPLTVALNSMTHLETKGIPSEVSRQLKQDVMEGKSLSDAMSRQSRVFTELYVNMVRAGEQSGALVEVLRRLGAHFERFAEVQSKFISALIYPAIVAMVGVGVIVFFMAVMLPKFMTIFEGMESKLPTSTLMVISMSHFFSQYWWLILGLVVATWVIINRYRATEGGRRTLDLWKLKAPVIGKVVRLNLFGQFCRTLSTLLGNGVPVLTALKISESIMPNVVLKEAIAKTREEVTDGKTIAQPLARSKIFPQLMIDLIRIGEDTGDVPGSLENLASTYENELSLQLRVLTNLIEPAMIITMAVGVGFLLFSVVSAMFSITGNLNR
ncbi:MAG: type II secretion system F family protein [Verrucomicrobiales bacterium]|nr:type II secretion system F family protein [Verrucomicrobiales bacterium]